jgi:hypothetical protein
MEWSSMVYIVVADESGEAVASVASRAMRRQPQRSVSG